MRIEVVDSEHDAMIDVARWRSEELDFWAFDRALDAIAARGDHARVPAAIAREVLTRAQRLTPRRTPTSSEPWFDRLLAAHLAMHDLEHPLVRADYDHALDAWQWTLRLCGHASAPVQLAALLHDVDTDPESGPTRDTTRIPQRLLHVAGVPGEVAKRTLELIACHERVGDDRDAQLVADADALSFFSLTSPGYLAYFGRAQTSRKVASTLARMSPAARHHLPYLRLPRLVAEALSRSLS